MPSVFQVLKNDLSFGSLPSPGLSSLQLSVLSIPEAKRHRGVAGAFLKYPSLTGALGFLSRFYQTLKRRESPA